jgi:6-phosphofructokinase 1
MGYAAVNALIEGKTQVMVGLENQEIIYTPFAQAIKQHAPLNLQMMEMAKILAS